MKNNKHYNLYLTRQQHKGLRLLAAEQETTIARVICRALDAAYPGWSAHEEDNPKNEDGLA